MEDHKSSFKILVELSDRIIREEMGDFYYVSASRMDNLLYCLDSGAAQIKALQNEVACYREVIQQMNNVCEALPELNMSNFDIDQVSELNQGVIAMTLLSREALEKS